MSRCVPRHTTRGRQRDHAARTAATPSGIDMLYPPPPPTRPVSMQRQTRTASDTASAPLPNSPRTCPAAKAAPGTCRFDRPLLLRAVGRCLLVRDPRRSYLHLLPLPVLLLFCLLPLSSVSWPLLPPPPPPPSRHSSRLLLHLLAPSLPPRGPAVAQTATCAAPPQACVQSLRLGGRTS